MKSLKDFLADVPDLAVIELRQVLPQFHKAYDDWHQQQTREHGWPKEDGEIRAEVKRRAAILRQLHLDIDPADYVLVRSFLPTEDLPHLANVILMRAEEHARKLFAVSPEAAHSHQFQVLAISDQGKRDIHLFGADVLP